QTAWSPDKNGGALGADNPTFHASIGWDWIPTIRGRNIGIWNDVYLSSSGPVTVENPFVRTDLPLPDTTSADVSVEVTLVNHDTSRVDGLLCGTFGDVSFSTPVSLRRSETKKIVLDPYTHAALRLKNPALWWPNGYGAQNLYDVKLWFETADQTISDVASFHIGVREMAYSELGDALKIWVNGRRFIGRGGNWGFPEANLGYRGREYDVAVRYHKDMNFTMIRNWVGQTGDEEFFDTCDRHGIMVWQDFWLANPVDGPNPDDDGMFLDNVNDFILRIRHHPSVGLYCGRNEGDPPPAIDDGIRDAVLKLHPGLHYISNSAFGVVSGGGPYRAQPIASYFRQRATPKFHSEMGMPNIVTYDSYQLMIPDSVTWPQGRMWGLHDFCLEGAQGGSSFIEQMKDLFGPIDDLKEWLSLAQWVNYQGYRAMFEAQSKYRMGLLLWMSHPAWPSFVWQTYDYYFEPTAAYFGCKKASEPLHIQWNAYSDSIEVVNYHARDAVNLTATAQLINLDGAVQWEQGITLSCPEDQTVRCFPLDYPDNLSTVYFIRLTLFQDEQLVSENFYWRGSLQAVRRLPRIDLTHSTAVAKSGDKWLIRTELENRSQHPALMIRLKVVDEGGDRLLPVIYSDNYVSLLPGEKRSISMQIADADTHGKKPTVFIEGLNIR
ncbi:beta-glycosidase, partial [candidate division KSB1 bacterium]